MNRLMKTLLVLTASAAPALAGAAIEESLARQIYSASGARPQLESIAAQVPVEVRQTAAEDTRKLPVTADEIEQVAQRAYDADKLEAVLIAELQAQLQPAEAQEVLNWLQSDLGKRFVALGIESGRLEEQAAMQAYAQKIAKDPPPEDRLNLIESLQRSLHVTEGATQLLMNMLLASSILQISDPGDEKRIRSLRDALEPDRAQLRNDVGGAMLVMLMYSYRDVSDADVQRYIGFCNTPAGDRYYRIVSSGVDRAMMAAGTRMGQELAQLRR